MTDDRYAVKPIEPASSPVSEKVDTKELRKRAEQCRTAQQRSADRGVNIFPQVHITQAEADLLADELDRLRSSPSPIPSHSASVEAAAREIRKAFKLPYWEVHPETTNDDRIASIITRLVAEPLRAEIEALKNSSQMRGDYYRMRDEVHTLRSELAAMKAVVNAAEVARLAFLEFDALSENDESDEKYQEIAARVTSGFEGFHIARSEALTTTKGANDE